MWAQQEQCSPARIVSGAGSLKSPGKRGGAGFSPRPRQRACQDPLTQQGGDSQRACQDPLTRQGGDALSSFASIMNEIFLQALKITR
jgi:hypothetical protein